ncbi:hypothetical protein BJP34_27630 [Moorena producens PAL-8-15-08-1]|uniref:eCIS core domain-containing protein n=1 Tax=Moorena producens PAL-8-15-08-1 TaxID=1458985 RepID=A0A1D8TYI3_9CYAN|nr:DUF4157 domain-containing protein [Moorena producens]AOX02711.1 hypothetical protein BJP34_27630 [Moorena producens PAL-8-15-08-1]
MRTTHTYKPKYSHSTSLTIAQKKKDSRTKGYREILEAEEREWNAEEAVGEWGSISAKVMRTLESGVTQPERGRREMGRQAKFNFGMPGERSRQGANHGGHQVVQPKRIMVQRRAQPLTGDTVITGESLRASRIDNQNKTGLPDRLKAGVENISGYSKHNVMGTSTSSMSKSPPDDKVGLQLKAPKPPELEFHQPPVHRFKAPPRIDGRMDGVVQTKLTIGKPHDRYEQEADRVAAAVVEEINRPAPVSRAQGEVVQGKEKEGEELQIKLELQGITGHEGKSLVHSRGNMPLLQRKEAIGGGEATTDFETELNRARGSGKPLDVGLQQSMGQAMGADFSGVRVHTDGRANQLNRSLSARAFTTGQDVYFQKGEYKPGTRVGQELIAHELTHVLQQTRKVDFPIQKPNIEIDTNVKHLGLSSVVDNPPKTKQIPYLKEFNGNRLGETNDPKTGMEKGKNPSKLLLPVKKPKVVETADPMEGTPIQRMIRVSKILRGSLIKVTKVPVEFRENFWTSHVAVDNPTGYKLSSKRFERSPHTNVNDVVQENQVEAFRSAINQAELSDKIYQDLKEPNIYYLRVNFKTWRYSKGAVTGQKQEPKDIPPNQPGPKWVKLLVTRNPQGQITKNEIIGFISQKEVG